MASGKLNLNTEKNKRYIYRIHNRQLVIIVFMSSRIGHIYHSCLTTQIYNKYNILEITKKYETSRRRYALTRRLKVVGQTARLIFDR